MFAPRYLWVAWGGNLPAMSQAIRGTPGGTVEEAATLGEKRETIGHGEWCAKEQF